MNLGPLACNGPYFSGGNGTSKPLIKQNKLSTRKIYIYIVKLVLVVGNEEGFNGDNNHSGQRGVVGSKYGQGYVCLRSSHPPHTQHFLGPGPLFSSGNNLIRVYLGHDQPKHILQ